MPDSLEKSTIRAAESNDDSTIAEIYNQYVTKTAITFEEEPVTAQEVEQRIGAVSSASLPWLVAEMDGQIAGYAYATPWKLRTAYRLSVEITIYLAPDWARRGIGSALYTRLFPILQAKGIHAVIGGIALPNEASIALHEKFGLRKVAHFYEVGFKFDRWIDVGYWQRIF